MPEIVDQERISALTGLPPDNGPLPNPAAQVRRIAFHEVLVRDPPAQWTANRYQQAVHYEGLPYIAIRAISDWFSGATIQVNVRANGARVQKALTNPGASVRGHDEEFHPAPADDPLVELFEHINPVDTVADFITQWTLQEELTGTVLVWVVRDQEGTPCEMWVLPTALATYLPLSAQYPRGAWQINGFFPGMIGPGTVSAGGIVIPAEDVLHYRKTHPLYRWDGFSPMTGIARQLDTLDGIDTSRKNAMDRGLNVDGVVTIEGATTDECERVQESLRNRYGGAQNSHKIIVAAAEGVKVDKLTIAPEDMEYQAGWEQMVKAVSAGFSVPPAVLGLTEAGSYAAYYAALRQFFSNNLVPRARRIGAFLTKHLARPISRAYSIEVHLPAIGDEDLQERQISSDAQNNAITVNQIEAIRGRKPVEGGDVPPQIYGAMLQAKVQQQFAPPQPPAMPGGGGAPDGPPADDQPPKGESDKMGEGALGPRMRKAFLAEHLDSLIATLAGEPILKSKDASGHEHKGKGPGGGQFVSQGGGDSGNEGGTDAISQKTEVPKLKKKKYGKSQAVVKYDTKVPYKQVEIDDALKNILGTDDAEEVASIVGAPDDAIVKIGRTNENEVVVTITHDNFTAKRRIVKILKSSKPEWVGKSYIINDEFWVKPEAQGNGIGADMFARQVENAIELGCAFIKCHAAQENPNNPSKPHNGYYTWPRFGYDQRLDDYDHGIAEEDVPKFKAAQKAFPEAKTVLDIMQTKKGRDWWKANGTDLLNARFDLTPESRSLKVLDAYLEEREASKKST